VLKSESLLKKRKKHGVPDAYPDFYSQINNFKMSESKLNPLKRVCRNMRNSDCSTQAKEILKKLSFPEVSNNLPALLLKEDHSKGFE
jgi:hypothetical protein